MLTSFSNLETFTLSFELNANASANVAKKQKGALNEHLFNASLCYIKKYVMILIYVIYFNIN